MKVLFVSGATVFNNTGGSELQVHGLGDYLLGRGHSVIYYFREYVSDLPTQTTWKGAVVYRNERLRGNYLGLLHDAVRLEEIVRKEAPDILFARCFRSLFVLRRVSIKTGVPFVYQIPFALKREFFGLKHQLKSIQKSPSLAIYGFFSRRALTDAAMLLTVSKAEAVVVQEVLGVEATTIYNMHPLPNCPVEKAERPLVVWINNIKRIKRPEKFIELVSRCSDTGARFIMSGRVSDDRYGREISQKIKRTSGIEFIGSTTLEQANYILARAAVNVITSVSEGFSNGMIQGWLRATPTITTVDKDHVVTGNKLGFLVHNSEEMEEKLRYLLDNPTERANMGHRSQEYANRHHNIDIQGQKYMKVFEDVCGIQELSQACKLKKD